MLFLQLGGILASLTNCTIGPHNQVHELCLTRRGETLELAGSKLKCSLAPRDSQASFCISFWFRCHSLNPFKGSSGIFYQFDKEAWNHVCRKKGKIISSIRVPSKTEHAGFARSSKAFDVLHEGCQVNMTLVFLHRDAHSTIRPHPMVLYEVLLEYFKGGWWFSSRCFPQVDYIAKHTKLVVSECLSHYCLVVYWVLIHPAGVIMPNASLKKWNTRSCGPMFFTRLRLLRRRHQAGSQVLAGDFFLFQTGFHVWLE